MTEEAQRIAIAESLGWRWEAHASGTRLWRPDGTIENQHYAESWRVPDYPHDLNACHEMEESLAILCIDYVDQLMRQLIVYNACFALVHATAAQRCEAYLKVKGLWKEDKQ